MPSKPHNAQPPKHRDKTLYGKNACLAFFKHNPNAIKRIFFNSDTSPAFKEVSQHCAQNKKPYRMVDNEELAKLTKSQHHEGVAMVVRLWPMDDHETFLKKTQPSKACILALEGIENPHNLGAMMRTAAHFGVDGILMTDAQLLQSGAALRTAEGGGSEITPLRCNNLPEALNDFKKFDYRVITTSSHGGKNIYKTSLPARCIFVLGNEARGLSQSAVDAGDLQVQIPGSGLVESLNVATATGVMLAEYWRTQRG